MKYSTKELKWIKEHTSSREKSEVKKYLAKKKPKKSKPAKKSLSYKITIPDKESPLYKWAKENREKLIKNQTKSEMEFYSVLDTLNIPYEKQYPFFINKRLFFADAVFHKTHTVIEIDGDYHKRKAVAKNDASRTRFINGAGYRVIRITNEEVYDRPLFMTKIEKYLPVNISAYMYCD